MTDRPAQTRSFLSGDRGLLTLDSQWRLVYVEPQLSQPRSGAPLWDQFPDLASSPLFNRAREVMELRLAASLTQQGYQVDIFPTPGGITIHWSRQPAPRPVPQPRPARAGSLDALWDAIQHSTEFAERLIRQSEKASGVPVTLSLTRHQRARESREIQAKFQHALNQLSLAESRFNLSLQVINEGFWDLDLTTGRIWRSDSYGRIFNLPPDFVIPDNLDWFNAHIHPEDRQRVSECFHAALAGDTDRWSCDYRILPGDGSCRYVSDRAAISRDADGHAVRATGALLDLTELRQKEADLHRLESQRIEDRARVEVQHKLLEQREMERIQLARDLHDGPIQSLSGLAFSLQMIREMTEDEAIQDMLQVISKDIHSLVAELRGVCNELRPPLLDKFGLAKALRTLADDFSARRAEPRLDLSLPEGPTPTIPGSVEIALYRIFQEALNNAVHHSHATVINAAIAFQPGQIVLLVHDNGRGFPTPIDWVTLTRQGHFGLVGIKERAEAINGVLTIQSAPGSGTLIEVTVGI